MQKGKCLAEEHCRRLARGMHPPDDWPAGFVRYINTCGQDKVMFGTDYPLLDFSGCMKEIEALNLRPEVLPKFMRDNAARAY